MVFYYFIPFAIVAGGPDFFGEAATIRHIKFGVVDCFWFLSIMAGEAVEASAKQIWLACALVFNHRCGRDDPVPSDNSKRFSNTGAMT